MNCQKCIHHGNIPGNAHISCNHTVFKGMGLLVFASVLKGDSLPLGVELDEYGLMNGWANWPLEFDPIWIKKCEGYQEGNKS